MSEGIREMRIPEILKKNLCFGNKEQIQALRALEESEEWCDECLGEGTVPCRCCEGSGKKEKRTDESH